MSNAIQALVQGFDPIHCASFFRFVKNILFFYAAKPLRKTTERGLCIFLLHFFQHGSEHIRFQPVVRVYKGQILSPCHPHSSVARRADALIFLMQYPNHRRKLSLILIAQSTASIGTAVIHTDDLDLFYRLVDHTVQTGPQIVLHIVDRNDDRYFRCCRQ